MLKKSLHFLKRFMLFYLLFSFVVSLFSCANHREDYLSFLSSPAEYEASLILSGEVSATFVLTNEGMHNDEAGVVRLRFTSPQALCGAEITYIGGEAMLTYNGISLEGYELPRVWLKVLELFTPCGEIGEVKVKDGESLITVIEEKSKAKVVYVLKKDGTLSRIESDVVVEITDIHPYSKGDGK